MKLMDLFYHSRFRPWAVWGLAAIFSLYVFLLQGTPSVMIPQLMQTYGIDVIQIGILTSSFFYTYILMQIPAGILIDIWGPKRVLKISFLLCPIAIGWFAFSSQFWEGQLSRMLMGLLASPTIIAAFCLGSRWFRPALFPLIVALTEFAVLAGGIVGEGGLATLVVKLGWRETMVAVAVLGLALTFLLLFIIHDYPDHDQPLHNGLSVGETFRNVGRSFLKILKIGKLWLVGIYGGLVFGIFPAFAALWAVPYFMNRYQLSVEKGALLASSCFFGASIGTLVLGWISSITERKRLLMAGGALCAFLLSLAVIYLPEVSLSSMYVLVIAFGFFSSTYALSFAVASRYVSPSSKGVAMGFVNMLCILFGAPLYQPLIGYLLKQTANVETMQKIRLYTPDEFSVSLSILPLSLLIAFVLSLFINDKDRRRLSQKGA